ncbi:MAG: M48 family metallopeptidase [Actinobacteria bacterium]|nr:M48 family metallopeptidase [Actinomycetota bacterium]
MKTHKDYIVIRRKVKYARLEVKEEGIFIILPNETTIDPAELIHKYKKWIKQKTEIYKELENLSQQCELFDHKNIKEIVHNYIEELSKILDVKPKSIRFRKMKKRWGSCSKDGKLIFNTLMRFLPLDLIRYVVSHELCHLKIHNHREEFWNLLNQTCKDFSEKEKLLMAYGIKIRQNNLY